MEDMSAIHITMSSHPSEASAIPPRTPTEESTQEVNYEDDEEYEVPPMPMKLMHCLSHADICFSDAMQYADVCKEGEIVLMNYYVSAKNWATISYLKKVDGQMIEGMTTGLKKDIPVFWQYDSCAFKWDNETFHVEQKEEQYAE